MGWTAWESVFDYLQVRENFILTETSRPTQGEK
jgi:hypothetical protein